ISKERSMFNSAGKFDDIRRVITVMASKGIVMPPDSSSGAAKLLKSTIFTHEPEPHENSSLLTDQFSTALRNCSFILPKLRKVVEAIAKYPYIIDADLRYTFSKLVYPYYMGDHDEPLVSDRDVSRPGQLRLADR